MESREKTEVFNRHLLPPPDCSDEKDARLPRKERNAVAVLATRRVVDKNLALCLSVHHKGHGHLCITVN